MTTPQVPPAILKKIRELFELETQLGHLPPAQWDLQQLSEVSQATDKTFVRTQAEQQTELIFGDICDDLFEAGFSPEAIAQTINSIIQYPGGPMYCSVAEVADSLGVALESPQKA